MIFWLIWALAGLGYEIWALASGHPADTLSEQIWHLEGHGWTFARYMVATLLVWLTLHLVLKIMR